MKAKWRWCNWCMALTIDYSCCGINACGGGGCGSDLEEAEWEEHLLRRNLDKVPKELIPDNPQELHDRIAEDMFGPRSEGNER